MKRTRPLLLGLGVLLAAGVATSALLYPLIARGKFGDCPPGYFFDRNSGIGCKQTYCNDVPNAHWSYEGRCVCGSSGSETEDPNGPNKECYFPQTEATCPGCIAKCVHFNEQCPGEFGVSGTKPTSTRTWYWMVQDAFSTFASIGGDLLNAATGIKLNEKLDSDAFYEATVIFPDGTYADLQLFHLNLAGSKKNGAAFEFNVVEIKSPGQGAFVDEWSVGIGLGAVNGEGASHDIPGTPISPHISFTNIGNWFSEKWNDVRAYWRDNAPWFLGGGEASPIPGMNSQ